LTGQVSLIHVPGLPIAPSPHTPRNPAAAFSRYPSARRVSFRIQVSPFEGRLTVVVRPNRVRHPTDRSFTLHCFPHLLTQTQLCSVSGRRAYAWRGLSPLWLGTLSGAPSHASGVRFSRIQQPPVARYASLTGG